MPVVRVGAVADDPLDAAARFHAEVLPALRGRAGEPDPMTLVFAPLGQRHRGWVLAAVQSLARAVAPCRVNAVAGDNERAIAAAAAWLDTADGVTGQLMELDGLGAGPVV